VRAERAALIRIKFKWHEVPSQMLRRNRSRVTMSQLGQILPSIWPGQNGNLPTASPSTADLLRRRQSIHAVCHELP